MSREQFEEPLSVLRWAREEIEKFKAAAQAFVGAYQPEPFNELDLATGEMTFGYIFREELPEELRRLSYYVVTNLRNALDQAMHAASVHLGTAKPNKTNFPVGDDANSLKRQLEGNPSYKGIPAELHPKIMSFGPYWEAPNEPDGNTILRSLLEVANPNKHRSPIKVWVSPFDLKIRTMDGIRTVNLKRIADRKIELFRTPYGAKFKFDADVEIMVAFDGGRWVDGKLAAVVFTLMADAVARIIDELRTETDRILAARGKGQDVAHS